jgi:hypothetical protein
VIVGSCRGEDWFEFRKREQTVGSVSGKYRVDRVPQIEVCMHHPDFDNGPSPTRVRLRQTQTTQSIVPSDEKPPLHVPHRVNIHHHHMSGPSSMSNWVVRRIFHSLARLNSCPSVYRIIRPASLQPYYTTACTPLPVRTEVCGLFLETKIIRWWNNMCLFRLLALPCRSLECDT